MAGRPFDHDDDWTIAELELIDGEERLPWLESDDEEEVAAGFAPSRLILFGVISLLVVGALVAAAWYTMDLSKDEPPADGSVIAAPEEPYKVKPDEPGGKTYPGTGDTSFAVGEGQTREGQLADPTPSPAAAEDDTIAGPSIASTLNAPETPAETTGVFVQVGAYPRWSDAKEAWARLMRQTEALNGVRHRVVQAQVDIGTVYRLQAITPDRAAAKALCDRLKSDGLACFVKS